MYKLLLRSSRRYRLMRAIKKIPGLVAYYPLSEVEGVTTINYAPANLGSLNGSIVNGLLANGGKNGRAFQFDGGNNRTVTILDNALFNLGNTNSNYTLVVCFKTNLRSANQIMFNKWSSGAGKYPWEMRITSSANGKMTFLIFDSSNNPSSSSNIAVDDNNWHMGVGVRDTIQDKLFCYIDGVLQTTGTVVDTTTSTVANSNNMQIGSRTPSSLFFTGLLQHLLVINGVLDANQLRLLAHKAGFI